MYTKLRHINTATSNSPIQPARSTVSHDCQTLV